ncbi:major facilitator superfamily protein [Venturia nashicola]|uniref:Major facilitator superfamily protein n=1 Tax=Venturia nashicola TaxID=86259 RepID=A0A4Z1NTJ2_9PEZI|nr:major facilitator superfamily protein [Venturia nashicola]TLD27837.1 major facilitator superfamily protein [Venturia nashicola]
MHYNIVTLEELEEAWEARKQLSVRQNSEVSVGSIEEVITWDSPTDPENPRNWEGRKKWLNILIISLQATLTTMASSILATALQQIAQTKGFSTNIDVKSLPIAIFVLGFGLGPLFLAPLSEEFGRRIVYTMSLALFTIFSALSALAPGVAGFLTFRFFSGLAGSTSATLGTGSVGDMFDDKTRGHAQAAYSFGPTMGAVLGALVGGLILTAAPDKNGWRWMEWVIVIGAGVMTLVDFFFLRETYGPFLLAQKAKRLQQAIGDASLLPPVKIGMGELFLGTMTRPLRLLVFAPLCTVLSLYMGMIQGVLYLSMVAMPLLFGPREPKQRLFSYNFHAAHGGVSLLAAGLGILLGIIFCLLFSNRVYLFMRDRYAKRFEAFHGYNDPYALAEALRMHSPEFRTPVMQIGMAIVPAGLFLFGWTANGHIHWTAPMAGLVMYSFGMTIAYVCIQSYLMDTFGDYAASAAAAAVVMRGILGCVLTVVGFRLFEKLKYDRGTTVLAIIMLVFSPMPACLYIYGGRLRGKGWSGKSIDYR